MPSQVPGAPGIHSWPGWNVEFPTGGDPEVQPCLEAMGASDWRVGTGEAVGTHRYLAAARKDLLNMAELLRWGLAPPEAEPCCLKGLSFSLLFSSSPLAWGRRLAALSV